MERSLHPDAIDTRLVLRIYAWTVSAAGAIGFLAIERLPFFTFDSPDDFDLPGVPFARAGVMRLAAAAVAAFGLTAIGVSRIDSPVSRQRALFWFAVAHTLPGALFFAISNAVFARVIPPLVQWAPFAAGVVLLFVALTSAHAPRLNRPFRRLFFDGGLQGPVLVARSRPGTTMGALRSQYEQHIRQAAQLEERARLARDLHDAVKQQLFAIHTSAATAQERLGSDAEGAHSAIEQIRASARDAMTEMDALIGQLQAAPVENVGLVSALKQQCEALGLRTGADVQFEADPLPPSDRLPPGAQQALFRAAQEALANVARHARAQHVHVRLTTSAHNLELSVRDDGSGFDQHAGIASGMGMANMSTRVAEVGGSILMQSAPGRGTLVAFSVPCDTSTSRDYARKAFVWVAISALTVVAFGAIGGWNRPWYVILMAVAVLTAARFIAAWHRVRRQAEGIV